MRLYVVGADRRSSFEGEDAIAQDVGKSWGQQTPRMPMKGQSEKDFGESVEANSAHGSDAPETAAWEISLLLREWRLSG